MVRGPLDVVDVEGIDAFRAVLLAAGQGRHSDGEAGNGLAAENSALWPSSRTLALRCAKEGGALGTLVKLFVLGTPVDHAEASAALAPVSIDDVKDLGLAEVRDGAVVATMRLAASGGLLLACDQQVGLSPRPDHVMGVTLSSALLASMTVRRHVESTLDVGTGCGLHALLAARHSEQVVATDLNPRAMNFTEFNCRLNDIDNVDCRTGSFLDPVAGETFDHIICNPPFVISPDHEILFRDAGRPGDEVSRELVQAIPAYLKDGGLAQVLVSWACRGGEHWSVPLRRWIRGLGCDVLLLCVRNEPAFKYAEVWNEHLEPDPEQHGVAFNRWLDYLQAEGIDSVGSGAVILRRRSGANWVRAETVLGYRAQSAGPQIARVIDAQDRLEELSDDELLEQALRPGPHHLEQNLIGTSAGYARSDTKLVLDTGLPIRRRLDTAVVNVVLRLDGSRRVADAIADSGADTGEVIGVLRDLVGLGALQLEGSGQGAAS
ncbi:MAG: methyltransferase [Acidimicrobiales bacterium]